MSQPAVPPQPAIAEVQAAIVMPATEIAQAALQASPRPAGEWSSSTPPQVATAIPGQPSPDFSTLTTLPAVSTEATTLGQGFGATQPSALPPQLEQLSVWSRDGQQQQFDLGRRPGSSETATVNELAQVDAELDEEDATAVPSLSPRIRPPIAPRPQDTLEITADRQDYDSQRNIVTATGNVVVRFARGVFTGDRIRVNLNNRLMVGEGNVAMRRGEQVFRGETFEYQITQDRGTMTQARGQIYQPTTGTDLRITPPSAETAPNLPERPVSDPVATQVPITDVQPAGGFNFVLGSSFGAAGFPLSRPGGGGNVQRSRFEADRVDFTADGWQATNARITNDPFSPPELEIQAETATFTRLGPLVDELRLRRSRLVFDQGFKVPFVNRLVFDRRPQRPGLFNIGFDDGERGGLFIERRYTLFANDKVRWTVTPQYLVQRGIFEEGPLDPASFGLKSNLDVFFDNRTSLVGSASLPGLDLDQLDEKLRASVRLRRAIGPLAKPHILAGEYSYRDRLFNGSLGFQTVQSSLGLVLTSPNFVLGESGVNFRYQGGVQVITADTDREELLEPGRENDRITLTRYQGATALGRGFRLWNGTTLPPTPTEGLRYTSRPVQPYLQLNTGLSGVTSHYSNGDRQQSLGGSVGLQGQFGHFSKPVFDYTSFNVTYSQTVFDAESPFLFDRVADSKTLSFGVTQQLYGPFRFGFQSAVNLDTGENISTSFALEYSRRTYSIMVRYFPEQNLGSFLIKIGDFNWSGYDGPFGGTGVQPVVQGVNNPF
ncbi:MAG: DUF3769 domain-containing protein [Spirulinaceae cyanobacterium]